MKGRFSKKDRKLGIAQENARYDLPLQNSAGSGFLMLLVGLMSFLAMMALAGGFTMNDITQRWSSGLENKATVEIPARLPDGALREQKTLDELKTRTLITLENHYNIASAKAMSREEIADLVSPWLGEDTAADTLPLPALISVQLKDNSPRNVEVVKTLLADMAQDIRLDTHESWLSDILKLTGTLQMTALVVTILIGFTTVTAIAGAIQSRMAEFSGDIELLHLMGASNTYISRQFQRHSARLAFKGAVAGVTLGTAALIAFGIFTGGGESGLIPSIAFAPLDWVCFILLPLAAAVIAYLTARLTVLRTLSHLPL